MNLYKDYQGVHGSSSRTMTLNTHKSQSMEGVLRKRDKTLLFFHNLQESEQTANIGVKESVNEKAKEV